MDRGRVVRTWTGSRSKRYAPRVAPATGKGRTVDITTWTAKAGTIPPGFPVARALPARERRTVGPFCFLDHFGPFELGDEHGMQVGPHPHIGLQTVTWLFAGALVHRDSLGSVQRIEPGELNLMTSGDVGVVHTERTPDDAPKRLHGVQMWTALPQGVMDAAFEHHASLPRRAEEGVETTVFLGQLEELRSPATLHTPGVGAELRLEAGARARFDVDPAHEFALFAVDGAVDGTFTLDGSNAMAHATPGSSALEIGSPNGAHVILLGGAPFENRIHMWWNYVAHDRQPIREAAADWAARRRFGEVPGDPGPRIDGPELPDAY